VAQRRTEIGLRMALGADRSRVLWMVLRNGMIPIGFGLTLGLVLSLALTRLMSGLLFTVRASDPLALGGGVLVLLIVSLLAILIPARRATRVDPMVALRYE
jgi:putative ABC transport system permease protein